LFLKQNKICGKGVEEIILQEIILYEWCTANSLSKRKNERKKERTKERAK